MVFYYLVQLNSNWIDLRKNRSEKNFLRFEDRGYELILAKYLAKRKRVIFLEIWNKESRRIIVEE